MGTRIDFLKTLFSRVTGRTSSAAGPSPAETGRFPLSADWIRDFDLGTDWVTLSSFETGEYIEVNDPFLRMTGYSRGEVIGKTSTGLGIWIDPEDRTSLIAELSARGTVTNAEFRCRSRSGKELVLLRSSRTVSVGGRKCILSVNRDVTALRAAERDVAKLSLAVEQSPVSVVITDKNGTIEYVNPRFEKLTGYARSEVTGQNPRILRSGHHPAGFYREMWAAISDGREFHGEMLNKKKNGELFWEAASISPLRNARGEITHFIGVKEDITERKRAYDVLRESEERYRRLVETAPDVVFTISPEGTIATLNPAYEKVTGWAVSDWIGRSFADFIHPDDLLSILPLFRRALNGDSIDAAEFRYFDRAGVCRSAEFTSGTIVQEGRVMAIIGVARDVTDRKRAEAALQKSRLDLLAILNNLPFLAWLKDTEGRFMAVNEPFARACGKGSPNELVGMTDFDVWPQRLAESYRADDLEVIRTERQKAVEERIAEQGTEKWYETHKAPLFDVKGVVSGTTGFARDISDRKRAEETLLKRISFESAIAAISGDFASKAAVLADERIHKALRIMGKTVRSDRSYLFLIDGGHMDNTHEWCREGIHPERDRLQRIPVEAFPWLMERLRRFETVMVPRVSGLPPEAKSERREFERESIRSLLLVPVAMAGRLYGFIGFDAVREEREWSLDDMRLLNIVAEIVASALERKRADEEIVRTRDAADVANRAKTEFLANMSHEIRTPMNAIIGLTDLVLSSGLSEGQRANLELVRQSAENLLLLLNQLLDLSKIEAGKMEVHETDFNLPETLDAALIPFHVQTRQKGISLAYDLDADVPRDLRGDAGFLRQVITNLVANAIKFTEQGGVSVTVRPEGRAAGEQGTVLAFSISDTGIGIPPDQRERIFESFTQADGSVTRKYGGTGLGLSISKRLVQLLGGNIWVESAVGKGSAFRFTARFFPAEDPSGRRPVAGQAEQLDSGRRFGALNVLVAEDNAGNQAFVRQVLEKRGHRVSIARNGREALTILAAGRFNVILMDIQMPEMDGTETLKRIRETDLSASRDRVPVIALTAHAFEADRERFLALGFNGYLSKPFSAAELTRIVEGIASRGPLRDAGPPADVRRHLDARNGFAPVDVNAVLQRLEGDRDILSSILRLYLQETPALAASLEQALAARLPREAERHAHSIKSVSGNIAAGRLADLSARIERLVRDQSLEQAERMLPELNAELERVLGFALGVLQEAGQ